MKKQNEIRRLLIDGVKLCEIARLGKYFKLTFFIFSRIWKFLFIIFNISSSYIYEFSSHFSWKTVETC